MGSFSAKLRRKQLDELLVGKELPSMKRGYIREIRNALEMSSYQLAARMGLSQSAVMALEQSEQSGSITLNSLHKAAAALGCKLVYGLVPLESLDKTVQERAVQKAVELTAGIKRTMALEQQSANDAASESMLAEIAEEIRRKGGRELWS